MDWKTSEANAGRLILVHASPTLAAQLWHAREPGCGYTSAIAMKITRRASFSEKSFRLKRGSPRHKPQTNWEAVTGVSTAASAVISLISAVISLVLLYVAVRTLQYTANQIEDFRKESQTQHFIEKALEFNSPQFRAVRRALAEERLDRSRDGLRKLDVVNDSPPEMFDELTFCNDLGILTRHGELSAYDAWGDFSFWLFPFYADAEPLIKANQKDAPASWSNCVYLMEQVRKVDEQEDAGKQLTVKEDDILGFYESEMEEIKSPRARGEQH